MNKSISFDQSANSPPNTNNTSPSKKTIRTLIIVLTTVVMAIIIGFCYISIFSTSKLEKALEKNDYQSVQIEYKKAKNNRHKEQKAEKLIVDKIEEMSSSIDKYDVIKETPDGVKPIDGWMSKFGTLLISGDKTNDFYLSNSFPFNSCVSAQNRANWNRLCKKINDRKDYTKDEFIPFELYNKENLSNESTAEYVTFYPEYTSHVTNVIQYSADSESSSEPIIYSYNLNGKYDIVSGDLFIPGSKNNLDTSAYLVAYGDGELLYSSKTDNSAGSVNYGNEVTAEMIKFDVSGVETLQISCFYSGSEKKDICLVNFVAQKEFK